MLKKHKCGDLLFLIIFMIVMIISLFMIIKPKLEYKNLTNNIKNYNSYENILFFDESISFENKNLYKNYLADYPKLTDVIYKNNLKIFISQEDVNKSVNKLLSNNKKYGDSLLGLYFNKYNLIVLKDYDSKNIVINLSENDKLLAEGEYKEFIKDKDSYKLNELYSNEELMKINNDFNKNVFYHEIGHFIYNKFNKNINTERLKASYEKERLLLFPLEEKNYIRSNINEFIAECISNYLNYGYVEINNKIDKNKSDTGKIISDFIDNIVQ